VDTAHLLQALLAEHGVASTVGPDLLARVGGNPLFAEEYARLLRDRRGQVGTPPVPATVQAVIAARLDTLPVEEKAVLADAAEPASEIDAAAAERALAEAHERLARPHLGSHGEAEIERERLQAQAEQAAAKLAVWKEYGSRR